MSKNERPGNQKERQIKGNPRADFKGEAENQNQKFQVKKEALGRNTEQ